MGQTNRRTDGRARRLMRLIGRPRDNSPVFRVPAILSAGNQSREVHRHEMVLTVIQRLHSRYVNILAETINAAVADRRPTTRMLVTIVQAYK